MNASSSCQKENAGADENHPSIKVTVLQAINKCHFANNADFCRP
jgi:hypothetical protein